MARKTTTITTSGALKLERHELIRELSALNIADKLEAELLGT
jgi:hypothetical protein